MEGGSELAGSVQEHALAMAELFGARLHAVVAWDPEDVEELNNAGEEDTPEQMTEPEVSDSLERAEAHGLVCEPTFHGEGVFDALLAEARESDLLVLGLPVEGREAESPVAEALLDNGIHLLRKAESSLLVVNSPYSKPTRILIVYQGGIAGKSALRAGGTLAEAIGANVTIASFAPRIGESTVLASVAENYLRAYTIPEVESEPQHGEGPEAADISTIAHQRGADFIVFGAEPYGLWESLFGHKTAERLALRTRIPVLIAR
jgi:nucleotide-binding universal stress UspA family protein